MPRAGALLKLARLPQDGERDRSGVARHGQGATGASVLFGRCVCVCVCVCHTPFRGVFPAGACDTLILSHAMKL